MTNPADANEITREYLDSILVEERLIGSVRADLTTEIFGEKFATPVMTPAFSHLPTYGEGRENALIEYSRGAAEAGALNWIGKVTDEEAEAVYAVNPRTIRVIKPFADHDVIYGQIAFAEAHGGFGVGMDIDHIFGRDGDYDLVDGERMGPQTVEDIRGYVQSTKLPFVIKGVLSVTDAVAAAKAGAKGIIVSHHHGRLPYAAAPLMVLPDIADALDGSGVKIFVDCHIDTGSDVFKCLALGADAAAMGRAMYPGLEKDGAAGVAAKIRQMGAELQMMMNFTGCADTAGVDPSVIWYKD